MSIVRTNRLLDMGCAVLPTVGVWWLLRAGFSPWARLVVSTWAVLWCLAFKYLLALYITPDQWFAVRNLVAYATGISFLAWAGFMLLRMGKTAYSQEKARSLIEESNAFFEGIQQRGAIELPSDSSINLRPGEFLVYSEAGSFYEYRTSGRSFSRGKSFRSFWGGSTFTSESQRDTQERLTKKGWGVLHITNQRVLVLEEASTYSKSLDQVVQMVANGRILLVSFDGLKKRIGVELENPYIPIGFHRWLKAAEVTEAALKTNGDTCLLEV